MALFREEIGTFLALTRENFRAIILPSQSGYGGDINRSNSVDVPADFLCPEVIEYRLMNDKNQAETLVWVLPVEDLHPFPDHPFLVRDDEKMSETVESIKSYGILVPAIVRPSSGSDGGYEIIAGHRRKHACELAGIAEMPCIVREVDDDTATIMMVDSNLQREDILPSERAKAYKMKLEAIKRQGERRDLTCSQVGNKLIGQKSLERIAEESGESKSQVHRFIRLTELDPDLQNMVDSGKMAMTPAVEISYLKPEEQKMLLETIDSEQATPSLSQAQRMKKLSQLGGLNEDTMLTIMCEQKKPELSSNITLSGEKLRKYFPKSYTPAQIENTIKMDEECEVYVV